MGVYSYVFLGAVSLALAGLIGWNASAEKSVTFTDVEAGFDASEETLGEAGDGAVEGSFGSSSIALGVPGTELPTGPSRYRGWSRYWQEFSPEEELLYGSWKRPQGPPRVGIQAGHWKVSEAPEELSALRTSTGANGGGTSEQAAVLRIAQEVKVFLEAEGISVDLLPATIPQDYSADAFISVHADGNNSSTVDGYKITGARRDFSGGAARLVELLNEHYGEATGLEMDPNITRRMSGYYAFNWRRYEHAVHPMTPAVIVETGFMTSPRDRAIIVADPRRAAKGIADGVLEFLRERKLIAGVPE